MGCSVSGSSEQRRPCCTKYTCLLSSTLQTRLEGNRSARTPLLTWGDVLCWCDYIPWHSVIHTLVLVLWPSCDFIRLQNVEWSDVFLVLSREFMEENKKCEKHRVSTYHQSPHITNLQKHCCQQPKWGSHVQLKCRLPFPWLRAVKVDK